MIDATIFILALVAVVLWAVLLGAVVVVMAVGHPTMPPADVRPCVGCGAMVLCQRDYPQDVSVVCPSCLAHGLPTMAPVADLADARRRRAARP